MGRKKSTKKRKLEDEVQDPAASTERSADEEEDEEDDDEDLFAPANNESSTTVPATTVLGNAPTEPTKAAASNYAIKTHSSEIFDTDIYVSDGSEDEEDQIDIVLMGSRMGIMRRGIHQSALLMQNRQWVRPDTATAEGDGIDGSTANAAQELTEEQRMAEELANLDPAQRAARLLQEKQRKLEEAKEMARQLESEENAGREPSQFSKRTAFDIRFDQIEDKPWERGVGDTTDFFNYGLTEEEWLEYGQQQLAIRQELIDANREKRPVNPSIVPVIPKKPADANPLEASVAQESDSGGHDGREQGPMAPGEESKNEESVATATNGTADLTEEEKQKYYNMDVGFSGAWGAAPSSDPKLAQLIEDQERSYSGADASSANYGYDEKSFAPQYNQEPYMPDDNRYGGAHEYYARHDPAWSDGGRVPPPPPPQPGYRGRGFAGRFDSRPRGGRGGRFHNQHWDGGRGDGGHRQYEHRGSRR